MPPHPPAAGPRDEAEACEAGRFLTDDFTSEATTKCGDERGNNREDNGQHDAANPTPNNLAASWSKFGLAISTRTKIKKYLERFTGSPMSSGSMHMVKTS